MTAFYAFYDGTCGLCAACRNWLSRQPQLVPIRFLPYQSAEAVALCPDLPLFHPEREIVVMADSGEIYQGDGAWITLLWATRKWRRLANNLSRPAFRGSARRAVETISRQRLTLSKLFPGPKPGFVPRPQTPPPLPAPVPAGWDLADDLRT